MGRGSGNSRKTKNITTTTKPKWNSWQRQRAISLSCFGAWNQVRVSLRSSSFSHISSCFVGALQHLLQEFVCLLVDTAEHICCSSHCLSVRMSVCCHWIRPRPGTLSAGTFKRLRDLKLPAILSAWPPAALVLLSSAATAARRSSASVTCSSWVRH